VIKIIARLIGTWFGCGYAPIAPGTVASLAAVAIAFGLHYWLTWPPFVFVLLAATLIAPGVWAAGVVARDLGVEDPNLVVVDEVIGQWIAIAGATTLNWKSWLGAFLLFRIIDIWKPPPIRKLEELPGGIGIVADDMLAGVYAALVIFGAGYFNLY
jgi:phosphatidylglycerophosphatase A